MFTLLLMYHLSNGGMQLVQVPGFVTEARCEDAMYDVVSDVEIGSEYAPLGWLLVSARCLKR